MISFFLPIFILSDNSLYLSHAFIDTLDTTKCNELQSKYIYRHENEFNNEYDECVTYYKSAKNFYCSSKTEVSSYFAKLSKDIDALYIINNNEELTLDFSQLTQQLKVVIYNDDSIESMNTNIAEIDSKILNILHQNTNPIKNENHIISKSSLPIINFDGNIKEKVSYMIVYKASVKITNNELNIHSLFLLKSSICTDSKMIKTNHLIIDDTSRNYIQNVEQNLIKVDQLCINFNIDTSNSRYDNFEIVFLDDAWYFYKRSYNYKYNSSIFYEGGHPYINYSIANTLGFISNT